MSKLGNSVVALVMAGAASCGGRTPLSLGDDEPPGGIDPPAAGCESSDDRVLGADGDWMRSLGASDHSTSDGTLRFVDQADGDLVVASLVTGPVALGCTGLEPRGSSDVLVVSQHIEGTLTWAKRFGAPNVVVDEVFIGGAGGGNVTIVGQSRDGGTIRFDESEVPADFFIASFDSTGKLRFARGARLEAASELHLMDAQVSRAGELTVIASLGGAIDLGGGLVEAGGVETLDSIFASWTEDGDLRWARRYREDESTTIYAMAVADDGQVAFAGSALLSGTPFVETLTRDGTLLWSRQLKAFSLEFQYSDGLYLGQRTFAAPGPFLSRLNAYDGTDEWEMQVVAWSESNPGSGEWPPYPSAMSSQFSEELFVAASLIGVADLGAGPMASAGAFDGLVLRVSPEGNLLGSGRYGGAGTETIRQVQQLPNGKMALTLHSDGPLDLGFGTWTSPCSGVCDQMAIAVLDAP